jgi:hypothetical protein
MEKELILDQMVRKDRENGMREKELSGLIERIINFEKKLRKNYLFLFFFRELIVLNKSNFFRLIFESNT